jgi:hypothetical protein
MVVCQEIIKGGSLIMALYGSQHFNITTGGSHKVDNDSSTTVTGSRCRSDTVHKNKTSFKWVGGKGPTDEHTLQRPWEDLQNSRVKSWYCQKEQEHIP